MKAALRPSKRIIPGNGQADFLLVDISTLLISVSAHELDSAIVASMGRICARFGLDRCGLWQFKEDRESLESALHSFYFQRLSVIV